MFNLQPTLQNNIVQLQPLQANDFDALFAVASDPDVWAQHPNKNRWQEPVFRNFFDGAMQSGGAFKIIEKATNMVIGSTRFYDYNEADSSIFIGYTFYGTAYWGGGFNLQVKQLMLNYAFQFVNKVGFHIGATNTRSQIAIGRLGAVKVDEIEVAYFGEPTKLNFVYEIEKGEWEKGNSVNVRDNN